MKKTLYKTILLSLLLTNLCLASLDANQEYRVIGGEKDGFTLKHYYSSKWYYYMPDGSYYSYYSLEYTGLDPIKEYDNEIYLTSSGAYLVPSNYDFSAQYPADLYIENIKFIKNNQFSEEGEFHLSGGESGSIIFDIINKGRGNANFIKIQMDGNDKNNSNSELILSLKGADTKQQIKFPISAPFDTKDTEYNFSISASEINGFDAESQSIAVPIKEVAKPKFNLESYSFNDDKEGNSWGNSDKIINPGESIDAVITISNTGFSEAENITATISIQNEVSGLFLPSEQPLSFNYDSLKPGTSIEIPFYFFTNKKITANQIYFRLTLTEKTGYFGDSFNIRFPINSALPSTGSSTDLWYVSPNPGMSCNEVCEAYGGFDIQGSQHKGTTRGEIVFPDKNIGGHNWETIECSSIKECNTSTCWEDDSYNTNWGANGDTPDGNWKSGNCFVHCKCNN